MIVNTAGNLWYWRSYSDVIIITSFIQETFTE